MREHIIDTVGEIGGHFGANLGTCELAVALHSVLESPRDKILWDVGHQAYPHKVLTGRRDSWRRSASTAASRRSARSPSPRTTSWAPGTRRPRSATRSGIKEGMRHSGPEQDGKVVAVIGDGAMTGGVAFEAIGQAGGLGTPIVVVLNDNGMSIAPNVGALSRYFNRVRLNPKLWHARAGVEGGLVRLPGGIGAAFERLGPHLKESIKAFWAPGLWWEELDWAYMGVIDGHDVQRAARGAARGAGGRTAGGRAHRDGQGQGLRAGRGGRPRGDGEVARGQAQVDPERVSDAPRAGRERHGERTPRGPRRPSTRRCSARRSCANANATSAWWGSPPR